MIPLKLNSDSLEFRRVAGSVWDSHPPDLPKVEIALWLGTRTVDSLRRPGHRLRDASAEQARTCSLPLGTRLRKIYGLSSEVRLERK